MRADGRKAARGVVRTLKVTGIALLLTVVLVGGAVVLWVREVIKRAPDIRALSFRPQGFATTIYDRNGNVTEKLVMEGANREEAVYDEIPEDLINAFIAVEDERFWENSGIDIRAILRAVKGVLTGDSSAGGGSTITQQLIKNSVFGGGMERTFRERLERKIQEQYLAVELTRQSDKKTIMTNYLNTINLGSNTLGVKVAARRYFDKELKDLTLSECAVLAGITKNPSRLNPLSGAGENKVRRQRILDKMEEQGMISSQEKEEALADDVYSRIQDVDVETRAEATPYTYFTDEVIDQVIQAMTQKLGYSEELAKKMIYSGGLSVYTTQDASMQAIVDEEINNPDNYDKTSWSGDYRLSVRHEDGSLSHYSWQDVAAFAQVRLKREEAGLYRDQETLRGDVEQFKDYVTEAGDRVEGENLAVVAQPQVSFVLMDQYTGQVLAVNGGRGEKKASRTLNRATGSLRQPGSVFKVLTAFAPALDGKNATLATVYYDEPYRWDKKEFRNWYGRYYGYSTVREAITYSMNIPAVRCMMETVSPQMGVWYARNLGITTLSEQDYNPSTALGGITDGVTNLELTAAFGAIGAKGVYTKPVFFTKVLDHDGNLLLENVQESHQALKPETAFLLTDAMRDVMNGSSKFAATAISPTGRRAALSSMTAAGKSGTTTGSKDLWFVGYTPYYTAGIWSGNDENQPITGKTSYHKDIWKRIMDRVHEGLENRGFDVPQGVTKSYVCRKSGKLALWGVCDGDPRGNAIYSEYFAPGTAPKISCDVHQKAVVCLESQGLATDSCPEVEEKVFLAVPDDSGMTEDSRLLMPQTCPLHPQEELSESEEDGLWESWSDEQWESWEHEEWNLWEEWQGGWNHDYEWEETPDQEETDSSLEETGDDGQEGGNSQEDGDSQGGENGGSQGSGGSQGGGSGQGVGTNQGSGGSQGSGTNQGSGGGQGSGTNQGSGGGQEGGSGQGSGNSQGSGGVQDSGQEESSSIQETESGWGVVFPWWNMAP
ncbi:MAG: penicillin-binding protein [Hungatella sp.]|nr:penicillin-binding protein [Hungatella sp.]